MGIIFQHAGGLYFVWASGRARLNSSRVQPNRISHRSPPACRAREAGSSSYLLHTASGFLLIHVHWHDHKVASERNKEHVRVKNYESGYPRCKARRTFHDIITNSQTGPPAKERKEAHSNRRACPEKILGLDSVKKINQSTLLYTKTTHPLTTRIPASESLAGRKGHCEPSRPSPPRRVRPKEAFRAAENRVPDRKQSIQAAS